MLNNEKSLEMEKVDCPLCGGSRFWTMLHAKDHYNGAPGTYIISRCVKCSLVMQNPRPAPDAMANLYPDDYEPHSMSMNDETLDEIVAGQESRRTLLEKHVPKGKNLDVGSGDGRFMLCLKRAGWEVEGCEFVERMARYQREQLGLNVKNCDLLSAKYSPAEFDSITFWASLEHLYNPLEALVEAARILKPGGTIIISLPNFHSLERVVFGEYWFPLQLPHHLFFFTPDTMRKTVEKAGMTLEKTFFSTTATGFINSAKKITQSKKADGSHKATTDPEANIKTNEPAPKDSSTEQNSQKNPAFQYSGGIRNSIFNNILVPSLKLLDTLHIGAATNYIVKKPD